MNIFSLALRQQQFPDRKLMMTTAYSFRQARGMRPLLRLVLVSWVLLTVFGRPVMASAAEIDSSQYFTVEAGDLWTMDLLIALPNGKELKATAYRKMEDAVEKDGKSYRRARTWAEGLPSVSESTRLYRREAQGAYSLGEKSPGAKEVLEMLFPATVGNTWKTVDDEGKELTYTVAGIESITIGDRKYENCIHLRIVTAGGKTEDTWDAPKMGTVKSESVSPDGVRIVLTLKEYKPRK